MFCSAAGAHVCFMSGSYQSLWSKLGSHTFCAPSPLPRLPHCNRLLSICVLSLPVTFVGSVLFLCASSSPVSCLYHHVYISSRVSVLVICLFLLSVLHLKPCSCFTFCCFRWLTLISKVCVCFLSCSHLCLLFFCCAPVHHTCFFGGFFLFCVPNLCVAILLWTLYPDPWYRQCFCSCSNMNVPHNTHLSVFSTTLTAL